MSFIETIIIFYFLALIAFFIYGAHRYILDKLLHRLPPGPKTWPFIGSAYCLGSAPRNNPGKILKELSDIYGPIFTLYLGQLRAIVLNSHQVIQDALVSRGSDNNQFNNRPDSFMPGYGSNILTHGVLATDGKPWHQLRHFCIKGLNNSNCCQNAKDEVLTLISFFDNQPGKTVQSSIDKIISNAITNVISCLIFGRRFAVDDSKLVELRQLCDVFYGREFKENFIYFALPYVTKFDLPPQVDDLVQIEGIVRRMVLEAVEERRPNFEAGNVSDFVDLFLSSQEKNDDDELSLDSYIGCIRDLFIAGTSKTSAVITWTILYLCKWPELQNKCQAEIDHEIGSNRLPNVDDRANLVYLEAVMREVLRHATILPTALFHATKIENAEIEGFKIPPETIVAYNIWSLHHDVKYWADPETFRPERWIDPFDGTLLGHSSHFMPFGVGPRVCLGETLASLQYFIFIAALLQRFNFSFPKSYNDSDILEKGTFNNFNHVPPKFDVIVERRLL